MPIDIENGASVKAPTVCPSGKIKPCKGKTFRHMTEVQHHTDFQELRLQEDSHHGHSSAAASVDLLVQDDLVDICQAGGLDSTQL